MKAHEARALAEKGKLVKSDYKDAMATIKDAVEQEQFKCVFKNSSFESPKALIEKLKKDGYRISEGKEEFVVGW